MMLPFVLLVAAADDWIAWPYTLRTTYHRCHSKRKVYVELDRASHSSACDDHEAVGTDTVACLALRSWIFADEKAERILYDNLKEVVPTVKVVWTDKDQQETDSYCCFPGHVVQQPTTVTPVQRV